MNLTVRIQNYHRLKEEREAKKREEQRLEKLKKEREKARVAMQTVQAHDLQVLDAEFKRFVKYISRNFARQQHVPHKEFYKVHRKITNFPANGNNWRDTSYRIARIVPYTSIIIIHISLHV